MNNDLSPTPYRDRPPRGAVGEVVQGAAGWRTLPPPDALQPSLTDYLRMAFRRKWLILLLAFVGLIGGFLAVILQPPTFITRTTIEVQGLNENFMSIGEVDPLAGTGANAPTEANIQTQLEILESATLLSKAGSKLRAELTPLPPPAPDVFGRLRARIRPLNEDPITFTANALNVALTTVKAKPLRGRIVQVTCESTSPDVAAAVLNELVSVYLEQGMEGRIRNAQQVSSWLMDRLQQAKAKLEEAESQLQAFAGRAEVATGAQAGTLAETRLNQLQMELGTIQADRISKQIRYNQAKASPLESIGDVLEDPTLRNWQMQLSALRQQRAALLASLTPSHPKVVPLDAQLAEAEAGFRRDREAALRRLQTDYENALSREKALLSAHSRQYSTVAKQAARGSEQALLRRDVETRRQLYQILLQQVNQSSVAVAVPYATARVIDTAPVPSSYAKPRPGLVIPLGLSSGLLMGALLALLLELMDRKLRLPGRAPNLLQVPELGVIPNASEPRTRWALPFVRRPADSAFLFTASSEPSTVGGGGVEPALGTSLVAEGFRNVLASVLSRSNLAVLPKVIVITSPNAGEGKTTIASNIAAVMAETGRRVLLIDADLRRPRLHQLFNLPLGVGLAALLDDGTPIPEFAPAQFGQATGVPGLTVLTAGKPGTGVSTYFHSERLAQLIARLRLEFDSVLIDSSPVLPFSDSRLLGRLADGVILVLRSGVTDLESAQAARRRFAEDGVPVLGTVLNDWKAASVQYGYYDSYGNTHR